MPSKLERTIASQRQRIGEREAPITSALQDTYDRAIQSLQADLDRITFQIRQARAAGEPVNPDWLRRQSRYQRLMDQAKAEFARFTDEGTSIIREGRLRSVRGGAQDAWELMQQTGVTSSFDATINRRATERAAAAMQDDSPLRKVLDSHGERAASVIEQELMNALVKGESPRDALRRIRKRLRDPYNHARLEALVRTEMLRAYRGSLNEHYAAMAHRIKGYRRTAAKGPRTCLACLARDGHVQKTPHTDWHICCRCIDTPVPIQGTIEIETGPQWLAHQPASVQRKLFPSDASFAAYQAGDLKLSDFVGRKTSKVWGPSLFERSGRRALAYAQRRGG